MGRITAIEKIKKSGSRLSIHVDGELRLGCDAKFIERFGLKVGGVVDEATLAELRHADELAAATTEAIKILGRRARSRNDLTNRLQAKKAFGEEAIAETVDWLAEKGLIDDNEYVSDRLSFLTGAKRMGRAGLVAKLISEGIDSQLAHEEVDSAISTELEQQWAHELAAQKLAHMKGKSQQAITRSIAGLLQRRGFEVDLVADVIENLNMYEN